MKGFNDLTLSLEISAATIWAAWIVAIDRDA